MGHIQIFRDFYSHPEGVTRTLRVFTPEAYDREPGRRFPVLYMCDGQNVFAHPESALYHTWCANRAMDEAAAAGDLAPWIIVGVDHLAHRFEEYSPWPYPRRGIQGAGDRFAECLVHHIRPFVDRTFRTLTGPPATAVVGASLGGLMALYLGRERPDVFGRIGAVSPTLSWCDGRTLVHWSHRLETFTKIYLDAGAEERIWYEDVFLDYASQTEAFYHHLRALGYAGYEVHRVLEPGGQHHEIDWQRRFPGLIRWLLA